MLLVSQWLFRSEQDYFNSIEHKFQFFGTFDKSLLSLTCFEFYRNLKYAIMPVESDQFIVKCRSDFGLCSSVFIRP